RIRAAVAISTYGSLSRTSRSSSVSIFTISEPMSDGLINLDVKRLKVLVTDDEAGIRRSSQLLSHAKGYDAHCYTTASALSADHEARSADCIIADYNMPDIDGLSLLQALRKTGWHGDAILITAYCSDDSTRRAKACGYAEV
ncbi:hypothetical protein OY671_011736, partial [Metschnikowia pulcherrima]